MIAYRFKSYSLRAARDIGEMVIAGFEEQVYSSRLAVKYLRIIDASFSPSALRVPLFHLFPGATLPHLRAALSTSLSLRELSLSLTPGRRA